MDPLILTTDDPIWKRIEALQWLERNTRLFVDEDLNYTVPLRTNYKSQRAINEIVGGLIY